MHLGRCVNDWTIGHGNPRNTGEHDIGLYMLSCAYMAHMAYRAWHYPVSYIQCRRMYGPDAGARPGSLPVPHQKDGACMAHIKLRDQVQRDICSCTSGADIY